MNESVQKWLDELTSAPSTAIQKLVLGYAGVSAWSRSSLRESFVEIFQTHAETLDAAVAAWLQQRLMKLPPEKTPTLVWASHLQDLFSAIAGLPLPQVARLLRDRLRDFRSWLRPLRTDESLDPEAAYLAALAWADTNQHLEGMWQGLALRRDREPAYYTDIGLLGLRKTRDERGQLPSKAPFLLLATLIDLADMSGMGKDNWFLTTRALLGGYHYSLETWVREFEPVLEDRQLSRNGPNWLSKILPPLQIDSHDRAAPIKRPDFTLPQCNWFVSQIRETGPDMADTRLRSFLDSHRGYASSTNDTQYLSKTFNRLAEAAKKHNPNWAVARAEEALEWSKGDPMNWTVLARCLWSRAKWDLKRGEIELSKIGKREAFDTLWTARLRIPYNKYIRTELARLHREAGDLSTAEQILREASVEFPMDHAPRCGLAEVLAEGGKTEDAEAAYREAMADFPDEAVPRDGLAALLHRSGRTEEAEILYRETCELLPADDRCRTGLADILFRRSADTRNENERDEAHRLYTEAAELGSSFAKSRLAGFDARWIEFAQQPPLWEDEEEEEVNKMLTQFDEESQMGPAQRLGRAILNQSLASRASDLTERDRLFRKAEALLTVEDELTGEYSAAFVEARGFLLLARDRATEARAYFEQQLAAFTRPPLGLRLGFAEARARLGETLSDTEESELASFGPEGSILPLVLKVVRLLESSVSDDTLRDILLGLYPRVRDLAKMPASELGEEEEPAEPTAPARLSETPDTMMAQLLLASVFRPAAINTSGDLHAAASIPRVRASLKAHRADIFSVAEKLALAA